MHNPMIRQMNKGFFSLFLLMILSVQSFAQSSNCATATQITLTGGSACVNGTSAGAISDNILYGGCNPAPVNMVWYTYVTNGSNNTFTVDPGTMTNAEIVIYQGNCPNGAGAALQTCTAVTGATTINNNWGMTAGVQVWIGIASNGGVDGTFQFCVNSQPPATGAGFTCAQAIPLCSTASFPYTTMPANSSGQSSSCFGSAPQRDIWVKFTCTQSGILSWLATPSVLTTEFDWVLWDVTSGCPGTEVCCNYNYGSGSNAGFGMIAQAGTVACGYSAVSSSDPKEFSPPANITCGKTYAIQVSNYSNTNKGFTLTFPGTTAGIGTTSNFGVSPQLVCGASLNAAITNSSTGTCNQVWSFGDGSATYTGGSPGSHNYTTPGTYAITANSGGACPSSFTQFIQLLAPLAATVAPTPLTCPGVCNGVAKITDVTGGDGVYTYLWNTGATTNQITGLCAGIYTVTISNAICGTSITKTLSVTSPPATSLTVNSNAPFCIGGTLNLTVSGASTYTWTGSGLTTTIGSAVSTATPATGTYSVSGTSTLGCITSGTIAVVINPKPSATLTFTNPTCGLSNGIVVINNTSPALPAQTISTYASSLGSISGQTVTGLAAGTPVITLTNNFGCTFTVSATLTMTPGPTSITLVPTNATCGNNNGSFTFGTPVGGTPTYSYAINGGAFSATSPTTGLTPATYSVTIKDANGCVLTKTTIIANIPGPTAITGTSSPASCAGPTGSYTVTGVTGGTATYSYSIDGGAFATTSVITSLASGTHSITVKDANGCTFPTTFNVGLIAGITSATVNASTASCGTANGTATVTGVTGGVPTYSYSYDGGGYTTTSNTTGLTAGSHTVIVKDVNTCTLSIPYTVLSLGSPTTSITSFSNVTCFGLSNGSCTVAIPTGGAGGPYTYSLTAPTQIVGPTAGTGVFTGLAAGVYNITVKDVGGCIATTSVTITQPTQVAVTATALPAKCFGAATGTINLTGSGGTPTYSYNLNGGAYQASSIFANQLAAIYTMGVKDTKGCLATQTVQVTQPTALAIVVASQNANCTAANGIGTTTVTGGTPTYTYTWTGGGGSAATSNGIVSGNYTVTATDLNGCVISSPVIIGLTPGGTASITALTNVTCNGANNGSMTAGMIGGSSPFTYLWATGGQTVATATNLSPGTYTCTITDFYGCKASAVGTISQPPVLTAIMSSNNVKCFGGSTGTVSAAGSGGTGPYTYLWSTIPSTLSTVNNVPIGNYPCSITDQNGCTITQSITVTQPTAISLTSTVTTANCNQANGSATVTASGGAGTYTYLWCAGSTTIVQAGLAASTCTVLIQDANNCQTTLAVTVPNAAGPVISITSQTNVSCFGGNNGAATTSVTGGVGTYTYSWSNGNTSSIATNLTSNIYTVSVTDGAGCVASTSVNITQPTQLTVGILPTNPKCFGATNGFGIAAASGGTPSYTYAWTSTGGGSATTNQLGAGNYGLTVTDSKGCVITSSMALVNPPAMAASITSTNVTCFGTCNGTAIATSTNGIGVVSYFWTGGPSPISAQTASGLCAGSYTVLATDQNSCTASAQVNITQPTQVTANITSTGSVTCNGGNNGFAVVTPGGGTGAYSYTWSPSGGNTATAGTLIAGVYVATVQDANLCTATATATIIQPTPLATTLTTTDVKCNGVCDGTGNVSFSGGTGTTTFQWLPGLQSGNFVNNLCVGTQTVKITSNGTCTSSITFTLTEPALLTAVASATNSNCGQSNGKACATVAGGTLPYTNIWNNGINTLCNNGVIAAAYSFTVTDFNGCKAFASGLVNDIAGPVVSVLSQTNISCFNGTNGAATTTITGGVPNYAISWTDGQTTQDVTNFNVGIKNITVVDAAGCVGTASVNITQPTQLVSSIGSFTNVTCNGLSNGGATMLVNGGTTPYTYTWTPSSQTSSVMIGVPANSYTGNITDAHGCTTSSSVTISEPQPLLMTASGFTNVSCFGGNNGQISTSFAGGTFPYTYSWTPSGSGGTLNGLVAGGYTLSLLDANNCPKSANFTITQPSVLTSTYTSLPATCGLINGSATVTVGGGTPLYNVVWNLPGTPTGTTAINMAPGNNWIASITDSKGCSITQTVNIANPPVPVFTPNSTTSPSCFGLSNGDITVNFTAGTGPYTVIWSSPLSQTITTSALTQSVAGVAAGLYTATLIDSYGCTTSQPVNVTQPGLLVLLVNPNPTICFGQTTQLNASGQNGTPGYSYVWSPTPFVGGGPHTVSPTTTSSYTVAVTDANGCSPAPKVITVNVTAPLSAIGSSTTLCHGEMTVLTPTITSPGNGGPYTYTWSPIAGNSSSNTVFGSAPTVATSNTFAVTISDGCTIPDAVPVFTVNVNPLPVISFTANPLQGCAPLTLTLTGTSDGGSDTFTWSDNRNGSLGQGNPHPVTFADSGKYTITLYVLNPTTGCSSTLTKPNYIEVYPQPIASFYADPVKASILDPNINFINTSQGATSYYWDFGDPAAINGGNISTAVNPSHGYTYIGEYAVNLVVTSSRGCKDTAQIIVEITPDFALYIPNTFTPDGNGLNDIFQPMGVGIDEDNYRMDIFDRWGENIFSSNNFRKGWDGTVKGGSKIAEQGVYTYKIMVKDIMGNKHPMVGHVTVIGKQN